MPVVRLALALLLALAPALNLAAPPAPPATVMEGGVGAAAPPEPCTHANIAGAGCGGSDHADAGHHADTHCLQCIAFGTPGLPGAPDVATIVPVPAAATTYSTQPDSVLASRHDASRFCRGPPHAV